MGVNQTVFVFVFLCETLSATGLGFSTFLSVFHFIFSTFDLSCVRIFPLQESLSLNKTKPKNSNIIQSSKKKEKSAFFLCLLLGEKTFAFVLTQECPPNCCEF